MKYQSELLRNIATSVAKNQKYHFNPIHNEHAYLLAELDSSGLINTRSFVKKHKSVNPKKRDVLCEVEIKKPKKKVKKGNYSGLYYCGPETIDNKASIKKSVERLLPEIAERFQGPVLIKSRIIQPAKLELKEKLSGSKECRKAEKAELTEDEQKKYGHRFPEGYRRVTLLGKYITI